MSKNKNARRAEKKHKKEKKRQQKRVVTAARAQEATREDPYFGWRGEERPVRAMLVHGLGPTLAERYAEQYEMELRHTGRLLGRTLWTSAAIEALSEEQVVEKLRELDVATDREAFGALAARHVSAWELAEKEWIENSAKKLSLSDEDFLCAAAKVQWSRWLPERPSREALDGLLALGYDAFHEGEVEAGVERWLGLWTELRRALAQGPKTIAAADVILGEAGAVRGWLEELIERALEATTQQYELGVRVEAMLAEMIEALVDEPLDGRLALQFDRAGVLWGLARDEEAEAILRGMITEHPGRPEGYIGMAKMLMGRASLPGNGYPAARELLEQAKTRVAPELAEEFGLERELEHLEAHSQKEEASRE